MTNDWYEPVSGKPEEPGIPLTDKVFAALFALLGIYFFLVGFDVIDRDLDGWTRVFYIGFGVFDLLLVYLNLNRRKLDW